MGMGWAPSQNWPRFAGKRGHAPSASSLRTEAEGGGGGAKPKLASLRWEARTRAERFKTSEGSRGGRGGPSQNWPRFAGKRGHAPSASRLRREAEGGEGRQAQTGLASLGSTDTRRALRDFGRKQRGEGRRQAKTGI